MAAPAIIQTNFTTGELAPEAYGRVDIAKYQNAAKVLKNCIVQVLGGAKGRGGFRFVAETKDSTKASRLIPFVFSREQSYMLEVGDEYIRVYKDGAVVESTTPGVPYELVSPYTDAMLLAMDYVQGADTMFLAHQEVPLNRLRRFGHADWRLEETPFIDVPSAEQGFYPGTNLTLSLATVGAGRTATASAATFLPADIGREIISGGGSAMIVGITSTTVATVDISSAFSATAITTGDWRISGSPQAPCTPSGTGPIGALTELVLGEVSVAAGTKSIEEGSVAYGFANIIGRVTMKVTAHGYTAGQRVVIAGMTPAGLNGTFTIQSVTGNYFSYLITGNIGQPTVLGTSALSAASGAGGWRTEDIGSYVLINGGVVRITAVSTNNITAVGEVLRKLTASTQAFVNGWTLESPVWTDANGYPRTVTLHAQRLVTAGSSTYPQSIWFSEIGNSLNMLRGTADDEGFTYTMEAREVNPIAFLPSNRLLMALTFGGEFTLTGGQEKPINPTNPQVDPQSAFGCALVRPILIGNQLFFVQRDGKVLRAASYQLDSDAYVSSDVSKLSKHLMEPGIVSMAFQQFPYSCIWMVREDGKLNSVTIDSEENVIAWTWHDTDGLFESVACIPGPDGTDQVWAIVNRTIDGNTVRYVELLDDTVHTDSCVTGTAGSPTASWSGFDHLEGETLHVVADDTYVGTAVVTAGAITLAAPATTIEAGLSYTPTVTMLTPELPGPTGSSQGKQMRISKAQAFLLESEGLHINGDPVEFRRFDTADTLDLPAPAYTGVAELSTLGWERGSAVVTFEQRIPRPFHLLAVIRRFEVNQ